MAPLIRRGNAGRSRVRAAVEHVFARQKGGMGLFVRTIGIARAKVKIGMANLVYDIGRLVWQERRRGLAYSTIAPGADHRRRGASKAKPCLKPVPRHSCSDKPRQP